MIHRICCLVFLGLTWSLPAFAGEPWDEPPRYSTLTDEQKKWLDERAPIRTRIERLQKANWANVEALNLVRSSFDKDRKVFGDNHEEIAKSIRYMSGRFYYAGEFETAAKLQLGVVELYEQLFGNNNWRARSAAFKLTVTAALSKPGGKPLRTLYGSGWNTFDAGDKLFAEGKFTEALAKYEQAARLFRQVGAAINVPDNKNIDLARTIVNAAKCHQALAVHDQAEKAVRVALEIIKTNYGDDHPEYATDSCPAVAQEICRGPGSFGKGPRHANRSDRR